MKFISADNIKNNITIKALIEEIESIYKNEAKVPIRQVHNISNSLDPAQLMLMPAFSIEGGSVSAASIFVWMLSVKC